MWWVRTEDGKLVDIAKADVIQVETQTEVTTPTGISLADLASYPPSQIKYEDAFYVVARFGNEKNSRWLNKYETEEEAEKRKDELAEILESFNYGPEAATWIMTGSSNALNLSQVQEMRIDRDHDAKTKSYKLVAVFASGVTNEIAKHWTQEEAQGGLRGIVAELNREGEERHD